MIDLNAIGIKPFYSFEQFVVGPNNEVAAAACQAIAKNPGSAYNPLFLYGPAGVGKTHLMHAVAQELLKRNGECRVKYLSAERFMNEIMTAVAEDRLVQFRGQYSQLDLLILDDVQYLTESKISQEELFHIFNNMHQENRQVIVAADRPPNQLTAFNKNVRSRLEWGLASDIRLPDTQTRLEILKRKQALQGLRLNDDMLIYVAQMLSSNVRELEGFLKRIHAYVTLSHQAITLDLVKSVVHEIVPEDRAVESGTPINGIHKKGSNGRGAPPRPVEEDEPLRIITPLPASPTSQPVPEPAVASAAAPVPDAPAAPEPVRAEPPKPAVAKPSITEPKAPPKGEAVLPELPEAPRSDLVFENALDSADIKAPGAAVPRASPPPAEIPTELPSTPVPANEPAPTIMEADDASDAELLPTGHKEVTAVFFYPSGCMEALESVAKKFQEVIKKHKLKFRLKRVHSEGYEVKGKINYGNFVDVCKANKVPVAIVIGPPPGTVVQGGDFYDLLSVTLDVQGISLQLVDWSEINKDYRYLNLALDIALVRSR